MELPPHHTPFLQPGGDPNLRDSGLHAVLTACFPVDGRIDGTGLMLDYLCFDLQQPDPGELAVEVTMRLSSWHSGSIERVIEQPLVLRAPIECDADELAERMSSRVYEWKTSAQAKISHASSQTTPGDLVFD